MKICSKCKESKEELFFFRQKRTRDKLHCYCKSCSIKGNLEWRKNNRKRNSENQRKWNQSNREKIMLSSAKSRAKRKGLDFNITIEDIVIPIICPILGITIDKTIQGSKYNAPALDRIDNTKGYIKGNVAIISHRANTLKSNLTIDTIQRIMTYMNQRSNYEQNSKKPQG